MNAPRNYPALLEHSFAMMQSMLTYNRQSVYTRAEFLSSHIFDFTLYDGNIDKLFVTKAIEVCEAIAARDTFTYIKSPENYRWYLAICNMPFFIKRLEWGSSIRGAWWADDAAVLTLHTCGLFEGEEQLLELTFTREEWLRFMEAIVEFARAEIPLIDKAQPSDIPSAIVEHLLNYRSDISSTVSFQVTPEEQEQIQRWLAEADAKLKAAGGSTYSGAIGGRLTYQFTDTNLGRILKVKDSLTNEELDVTDYASW